MSEDEWKPVSEAPGDSYMAHPDHGLRSGRAPNRPVYSIEQDGDAIIISGHDVPSTRVPVRWASGWQAHGPLADQKIGKLVQAWLDVAGRESWALNGLTP